MAELIAMQSFVPPHRVLMGPGPSDVPKRVLEAMSQETIGHLDPAFVGLMDEIKELLRRTFRTRNAFTFPVSGPGSAGMEMCFTNLVEPGDTVVICRNGVFGGRMVEVVSRCGGIPVVVDDEWGRAANPEKLHAALEAEPHAKIAAFVQAETSTGAESDARELAAVARQHDCLVVMDAVTSLAGSPVCVDEWGIDACYSGTQKCLSCPPGLWPVTFSDAAVDAIKARRTPCQSWFMDFGLLLKYWDGGTRTYHHTAPVSALYGLREALLVVQEEGLEAAWARHRANHLALKAGLDCIGLTFLVDEEHRLPQLNAVTVLDTVDEADVRRRLLTDHGIEIGAGLGALAGRIWRVGLMGHSSRSENVLAFVTALAAVGEQLGLPMSDDAAREAVERSLRSADPGHYPTAGKA